MKHKKKSYLDCKRERYSIYEDAQTPEGSLNFVPACSRQLVRLPLFLVANELLFLCSKTNSRTVEEVRRRELRFDNRSICGKNISNSNKQTKQTRKSFTLGG